MVTFNDSVKISEIKPGNNPRKDLGDLSDLQASIAAQGIIEPLILKFDSTGYTLIAGHRRLAAAKANGLLVVPAMIRSTEEKIGENDFNLAIIENIQRKDLTPIEEGMAFSERIKKSKQDAEHLAKELGKKKEYVERRIALLKLIPEARQALNTGKIQLGHAVVLTSAEPDVQKALLVKTLRDKVGIHELANEVRYIAEDQRRNLEALGVKQPKGQFQAVLDQTGEKIDGIALGKGAYEKALRESMAAMIADYKEKGARVVDYNEAQKMMEKGASQMHSYNSDYKKISENDLFKNPKDYAICIAKNHYGTGRIEKFILSTKKEPRESRGPHSEKENLEHNEDLLNRKVRIYREQQLRAYCSKNLPADKHAVKVTVCYELIQKFDYSDEERALEIFERAGATDLGTKRDGIRGIGSEESLFALLVKKTDAQLDALLTALSTAWMESLQGLELEAMASTLEYDAKKEFKMSVEFIDFHKNSQLEELAKELGVDIANLSKKYERAEAIMAANLKGKVPKVFEKAKEAE